VNLAALRLAAAGHACLAPFAGLLAPHRPLADWLPEATALGLLLLAAATPLPGARSRARALVAALALFCALDLLLFFLERPDVVDRLRLALPPLGFLVCGTCSAALAVPRGAATWLRGAGAALALGIALAATAMHAWAVASALWWIGAVAASAAVAAMRKSTLLEWIAALLVLVPPLLLGTIQPVRHARAPLPVVVVAFAGILAGIGLRERSDPEGTFGPGPGTQPGAPTA
jgi:hypothetical protein